MPHKTSIFSFFSGLGLLDLGFESSGFDIVYVSDVALPFLEGYRYSREILNLSPPQYGFHAQENGDVERLIEEDSKKRLSNLIQDARRQSEIIGFIGGPPCPDFSIGGKNRGKEGNQGKLSECFTQLICQQKPDFFLFENVKGLWRTKKHRVFYENLKMQLLNSGYALTEKLINTLEFGVPQDRERIILIGFKCDLLQKATFCLNPKSRFLNAFPWYEKIIYSSEFIKSKDWPLTTVFQENSIYSCPNNILKELTVEEWFIKNDVYNHPNSQHYFKPRAGLKRFLSIDEGDDSKKSFKRLHRWRYSPTACYGNNEVHLHPYKARRISVAEALAIQSLPKDFVLSPRLTLTDMFKSIGNGVPYVASKGLAQSILCFIEKYIYCSKTTPVVNKLKS